MIPFQKPFLLCKFRYVSTLRILKDIFSGTNEMFFLYGSNNSDPVVFGNAGFGKIKDHKLIAKPLQKYFLLWNF